jgi:hypothetical protein
MPIHHIPETQSKTNANSTTSKNQKKNQKHSKNQKKPKENQKTQKKPTPIYHIPDTKNQKTQKNLCRFDKLHKTENK